MKTITVIPTYNEKENVEAFARAVLSTATVNEILFVAVILKHLIETFCDIACDNARFNLFASPFVHFAAEFDKLATFAF